MAAKIARSMGPSAMARSAMPGRPAGEGELGQQRHREPARDEREADRRVVGAVADVGVEAPELAAGAPGHLLPAHLGVAGRPRLAGERGERHGVLVAARERVAGGEHDEDGVREQLVALDALGR